MKKNFLFILVVLLNASVCFATTPENVAILEKINQLEAKINDLEALTNHQEVKQEISPDKVNFLKKEIKKQRENLVELKSLSTVLISENNKQEKAVHVAEEKSSNDQEEPKKNKCGCQKKKPEEKLEDYIDSEFNSENETTTKEITAEEQFNEAYNAMNANNLVASEVKFSDFLWKHPKHKLTPLAYFWLGEINLYKWQQDKLDKHNLDKAIAYYKTIVNNYKEHMKYKDALLKLGVIESKRGNNAKAREYFLKAKNKFPNSSISELATINLQKLE